MKCPYCREDIENKNAYDKVSHIKECENNVRITRFTIKLDTMNISEEIEIQAKNIPAARIKFEKWLDFIRVNHEI